MTDQLFILPRTKDFATTLFGYRLYFYNSRENSFPTKHQYLKGIGPQHTIHFLDLQEMFHALIWPFVNIQSCFLTVYHIQKNLRQNQSLQALVYRTVTQKQHSHV